MELTRVQPQQIQAARSLTSDFLANKDVPAGEEVPLDHFQAVSQASTFDKRFSWFDTHKNDPPAQPDPLGLGEDVRLEGRSEGTAQSGKLLETREDPNGTWFFATAGVSDGSHLKLLKVDCTNDGRTDVSIFTINREDLAQSTARYLTVSA
ncbi:MAG: hypothetical protein HY319_00685 [Armatimonadetes bacterium]|nr:hypothetical protein [Armatimonadota bacterium]